MYDGVTGTCPVVSWEHVCCVMGNMCDGVMGNMYDDGWEHV